MTLSEIVSQIFEIEFSPLASFISPVLWSIFTNNLIACVL